MLKPLGILQTQERIYDRENACNHQFEYYFRFVTGLLVGACTRVEPTLKDAGLRAEINDAMEYLRSGTGTAPVVSVQALCDLELIRAAALDELSPETAATASCNLARSGSARVLDGRGAPRTFTIAPLLAPRGKESSRNELLFACLWLFTLLRRALSGDAVLEVFAHALCAMDIACYVRDTAGSHGGDRYRQNSVERELRAWLIKRGDPLFSEPDAGRFSLSLILPVRVSRENPDEADCLTENENECHVPLGELGLTAPGWNDGRLYARLIAPTDQTSALSFVCLQIWPYCAVRAGAAEMCGANSGYLHLSGRGELSYRNMVLEPKESEGIFALEPPRAPIRPTTGREMQTLCPGVEINSSRHPEFFRALDDSRKFAYYPVIGPDGIRRIDALLTLDSAVQLVFMSGHGGLGKTHFALNLLRNWRKRGALTEVDAPVPFRQVIFLSAKRRSVDLSRGQVEDRTEHDIETCADLVKKLGYLLFGISGDGGEEECQDVLKRLKTDRRALLLIVDDLDTVPPTEQANICALLERIKSNLCRVLVTTRIITPNVMNAVTAMTTVNLLPLEQEESWKFAVSYLETMDGTAKSGDERLRAARLDAKLLQNMTGGVPLNLVLTASLIRQGNMPGDVLLSQAQNRISNSTTFIFTNVIQALRGQDSGLVLGVLTRFLRLMNIPGERTITDVSYATLRLLTPQVPEDALDNALRELDDYAVIYHISEDPRNGTSRQHSNDAVSMRSTAFCTPDVENALPLTAPSSYLLDDVTTEPKRWNRAMGDPVQFLKLLQELTQSWWNRGGEYQTWAGRYADLVTTDSMYQGQLGSNRTAWQTRAAGDPVAVVEKHLTEMEQAAAQKDGDRMMLACRTALERLSGRTDCWPDRADALRKCFDRCAWAYDGAKSWMDSSQRRDFLRRLTNAYENFSQGCGLGYNETLGCARCEELLDDEG